MNALLIVGLLVAGWALTRTPGCHHVDEDGRSLLSWSFDPRTQRLRGFCWNCHRFTTGWPMAKGGRS